MIGGGRLGFSPTGRSSDVNGEFDHHHVYCLNQFEDLNLHFEIRVFSTHASFTIPLFLRFFFGVPPISPRTANVFTSSRAVAIPFGTRPIIQWPSNPWFCSRIQAPQDFSNVIYSNVWKVWILDDSRHFAIAAMTGPFSWTILGSICGTHIPLFHASDASSHGNNSHR